jgi:ATP-dependent helicase/nuclease subunit B
MAFTVERVFVGWDRPLPEAAVEALIDRFATDHELDLGGVTAILPGGRAGRLLLATLVEAAEARGLLLTPPTTSTPSGLGGLTPTGAAPVAGPIARRLAWISAMRKLDRETLEPLVPHPPAGDDERAWGHYASVAARCHRELAGENLYFAEVAARVEAGAGPGDEAARWRALAEAQAAYQATLKSWGLADDDLDRMAWVRRGDAADLGRLVLIGVPELTGLARAILQRGKGELLTIVAAPAERADAFDALGCVRTSVWGEATLPIDHACIERAEGPRDAAERALIAVSRMAEAGVGPQDVTVVMGDRDGAAQFHHWFEHHARQPIHDAAGVAMTRTGPYRLLHAAHRFVERRRFADYVRLLQHPVMIRYVDRRRTKDEDDPLRPWRRVLDDYQAEHIADRVDARWWLGRPRERATMQALYRVVEGALGPLMEDGRRPIRSWAEPMLDALVEIFTGVELDRSMPTGRRVYEALVTLRGSIAQLENLPDAAGEELPLATAADALGCVLEDAAATQIADDAQEQAVEVVDWLEAAHDPAAGLVIVGANEGGIPARFGQDPLLPDGLRSALGIACHASRLARDLYLLTMMQAMRSGDAARFRIVVPTRGSEGDPLWPSRLLLRDEPDAVVERIRMFAEESTTPGGVRFASALTAGRRDRFEPMPRRETPRVESMTVTSFRTFLTSPYLFYLQHVLRLEEHRGEAAELDPLQFGSLVHEVLERFARSDVRHATDEATIAACLMDELATVSMRLVGGRPSAAVSVQLLMAEGRLKAFARWQAKRTQDGWLIHGEPEWRPSADGQAPFDVDGSPMMLRGKIDRIDRHEPTGRMAILDYKTGESAADPKATHGPGRGGVWKDLQLPLYRHLAAELDLGEEVTLGYVVLPSSPSEVGLRAADWTKDQLLEADEAARDVVRLIRGGEYFELLRPTAFEGTFASIAGVGFIRGTAEGDDEEGEE